MNLKELGKRYRVFRNELWDLGSRIEAELLTSDLSDAEAAALVGWTESTVTKIRTPKETPDQRRAARESLHDDILAMLTAYGTEYHEALRMICESTGWTVPAAKRIVGELETLGKVVVKRNGRRIVSVSLPGENSSQLGL